MFDDLFTAVTDHDKRFVVYDTDEETDVRARFANHNIDVGQRELPAGPDPFLVIEEDGEFAGALPVDSLDSILEPPVVQPGDIDEISKGYRVLFEVLNETIWTAMELPQLMAVSREIEDRAARVGNGTFRVSFQLLSSFEDQVDMYRRLANRSTLDIHIYGAGDWTPPEIPGITYHRTERVRPYWLLAFDGGDTPQQACAFVARENDDGYNGVWTYDRTLVSDILAQVASC